MVTLLVASVVVHKWRQRHANKTSLPVEPSATTKHDKPDQQA